jgi:hypothetical protein
LADYDKAKVWTRVDVTRHITTWIRRENASSGLKRLQLGCPGEYRFREIFYHR